MLKIAIFCLVASATLCVALPDVSASVKTTQVSMQAWMEQKKIASDPVAPGVHKFTVERPEGTRSFYAYVPKNYSANEAIPLVIAFHGLGDTCENFGDAIGFKKFADERNFLYVYPCSTSGLLGTCWNSGVCCCGVFENLQHAPDDVQFTRDIVSMMSSTYAIKQDRIYAAGFSNGAFMAEILGCVASHIFNATASVSGVVELQPGNTAAFKTCDQYYSNATNKVSVLNIHGTLDFVVPWTGDLFLGFPPIPDDFKAWATRNGCKGEPKQTFSKGAYSNQIYEDCENGSKVQLVKNSGGGHEWPEDKDFDTSSFVIDWFNL